MQLVMLIEDEEFCVEIPDELFRKIQKEAIALNLTEEELITQIITSELEKQ